MREVDGIFVRDLSKFYFIIYKIIKNFVLLNFRFFSGFLFLEKFERPISGRNEFSSIRIVGQRARGKIIKSATHGGSKVSEL